MTSSPVSTSQKRWPDLVNVLTRKAEHAPTPADRVALHLQVAGLYIERFSSRPRRSRPSKGARARSAESDRDPASARRLREAARLGEADPPARGRIERTADLQQRFDKTLEVAKLAATKVKKPELCITWWEKVLQHDPPTRRRSTSCTSSTAQQGLGPAGRICSKLANIASDPRCRSTRCRSSVCSTPKLEDTDKAIDAWRRLLDIDPENRRGQDAIKKLFVTAGRWDELEDFYKASGKMDEFVRVLERQVETADGNQLGVARKIAFLYRDVLQKPDRAMRAFEKVLQLDGNNLEAAEALIPLYEAGRDPRKLAGVLEIQIANTPAGGSARAGCEAG
jgi:tetratricopeptide (TPR) repeat protein